ncbi:hypothetical protein EG799_07700 [Aurantiacibacter spongiae]|uniref:Nodulation protein Z n=2 Tax=Aurantiacibacter spongiae TaxID=2488860 RepID=A0A3N5DTL2_9SPHN|nr:hypothetical protein EG799_07700 [Aurantiacibacter spongiae]
MLSAVTACVLAELVGRAVAIDWRDGMYLPEGQNLYPLLFDDSQSLDPARFDEASDVTPAIWAGSLDEHPADMIRRHFPASHRNPLVYRKLCVDLANSDPASEVAVFWSYLPKMPRLRRRLAHDARFAGRPERVIVRQTLKTHFTPVEPVLSAVDALFARFSGPVIGVHIRFTDRKAPLPKILERIRGLREQEPDAPIFLATDSAEAQDAVHASFDNVHALEKTLSAGDAGLHFRSDEAADPLTEARAALADMIALSRCEWLVHSSHSTFSVTAALIGDIPPGRQRDVDRYNVKVQAKRWFQSWV